MKRAKAYVYRSGSCWYVTGYIRDREGRKEFFHGDAFPTHEAALAHALAEVGLTEKNTEKEN